MKKVCALLMAVVMLVSMTACAGSNQPAPVVSGEERPGVVAEAEVLGPRDTQPTEPSETPTESVPVETDPVETELPTEPSTEPTETTEPDYPITLNSGYRYQDYVLRKALKSNAVFSGETFLMALDMWRELIDTPDRDVYKKYISRDYLGFDPTAEMVFLNRMWVDSSVNTVFGSNPRLAALLQQIDMTDPSSMTVKNNWVSQQTNGYINYTPSVYTESTKLDMMSVAYFCDTWLNGAKPYDSKTRIFYNADGTETKTVMIRDESLTYWNLGNATAYCMYFNGGNYMMVVVPDKNVSMTDVDVHKLMVGDVTSRKAHVRFYMPSFAVESTYVIRPSDMMLPVGKVLADLMTGLPANFEPTFSQIVKLSISAYGAGPAYDEKKLELQSDYSDDLDVINIICDRPFMYYIGDAENEDILFFGVVNQISEDMAITPEMIDMQEVPSSEPDRTDENANGEDAESGANVVTTPSVNNG